MRLAYNALQAIQYRVAMKAAACVFAALSIAFLLTALFGIFFPGYGSHAWLVALVLLFGALGGIVSIAMRSRGLPASNTQRPQLEIVHLGIMPACRVAIRNLPFLSALQGAVGALLLYCLFQSGAAAGKDGLISSAAFPTLGKDWSQPPELKSCALLLVWSFVAGFSERLVPDLLDHFSAKAGNKPLFAEPCETPELEVPAQAKERAEGFAVLNRNNGNMRE
jgi:hypothetical protein